MPSATTPRHLDVHDAPARQVRILVDATDIQRLLNGHTLTVVSESPNHRENVEVFINLDPQE